MLKDKHYGKIFVMTQGGRPTNGGIVHANSNPYGGVDRVLLTNSTSPDKVFGSSMPNLQPGEQPTYPQGQSSVVYGNENYVNPNLRGYSNTGQNIIDVNQLNNAITPMTSDNIAQLRRDSLIQDASPVAPASNPNQMYMQPPTIPQISDMQSPTITAGDQSSQTNAQPVYHDLSTAEGNLDYLNSIAPTNASRKSRALPVPNKLFVGAGIGVIVLVVIVAIIGAIGGNRPSLGARAQELGKAIANLQSIVEYGESKSQYISSDLDGVIAETHLVTLSHQTELSKLMALAINEDGEATEAEADETTTDDLDKALSQGQLNNIYQTALQERLTNIAEATEAAYNATNNDEIKNALNETYIDVENLLSRLEKAVPSGGGGAAD